MLEDVKSKIVEVRDFPVPGIGFKDITPLIEDSSCFHYLISKLSEWAKNMGAERIAGIESRGFIFAAPVAFHLQLGLTLIRKKGKLPRKTVCVKAPNEYAVEYFEAHEGSVEKGQKVIIIDDLIATGSSSASSIELIQKVGGSVAGFVAAVELSFLKGADFIKAAHPDVAVYSLIQLED